MKKLVIYIKKRKVAVLFVLLVVTSIIYVATSEDSPLSRGRGQRPTPTASGTPRPISVGALKLTGIQPSETEIRSLWSVKKITFSFDRILDANTVEYTIRPERKTRLIFESPDESLTSFSILPLEGWEEGVTYTITISDSLRSVDSYMLEQPIRHSFKRVVPTAEEMGIPNTGI